MLKFFFLFFACFLLELLLNSPKSGNIFLNCKFLLHLMLFHISEHHKHYFTHKDEFQISYYKKIFLTQGVK